MLSEKTIHFTPTQEHGGKSELYHRFFNQHYNQHCSVMAPDTEEHTHCSIYLFTLPNNNYTEVMWLKARPLFSTPASKEKESKGGFLSYLKV